MSGADDRDERIRLLEYQVAFLHHELTFVTKRYEDMLYSAAWTLARPVKRVEHFGHRLVKSLRGRKGRPPLAHRPVATRQGEAKNLEDRIAARIAAKMERPPAGV